MKRRDYLVGAVAGLSVTAGCSKISDITNRPEAVGSKEYNLEPGNFAGSNFDLSKYHGSLEYKVKLKYGAGTFRMSFYNIDSEETARTTIYLSPNNNEEMGSVQLTNEKMEVVTFADDGVLGLSLTFDFEIYES